MASENTKLKHVLATQLHLYYEDNGGGKGVLRHIRVNGHFLDVPEEGITIETLPPDIISSEHIKDGAIRLDDLNEEVAERTEQAMQNATSAASAAESAAAAAQQAVAKIPEAGAEADIRSIVRDYE